MLSLCWCQLRHIKHASINTATSIIGGRRWHGIWRIRWSPTRYWRSLQLMRCFLQISGWLLTNRGQPRWIDDLIIQWKRHRYHRWWQLVALWATFLVIKSPVITRSPLLPTLIVPCSTFAATANTLWTWNDEWNMSLWWCCVPVILFVDGHQKVRAKILAQQLQSCLSFSTRNKIDYEIFVSI